MPLACKTDVVSWNAQADALRKCLLTADLSALGPQLEFLHDYLSDAEIRLCDPDYAAAQERIIRRLIARLRQENEPARVSFG